MTSFEFKWLSWPEAADQNLSSEVFLIRAALLIQIDWIAGAMAGVLMLSLYHWLSDLYQLPRALLLFMGLANLTYASGSLTLNQLRRGDRVPFLRVIAGANVAWALGCVILAVVWSGRASVWGMGQLIGEAIFVGGLGVLEWQAAGRLPEADRV